MAWLRIVFLIKEPLLFMEQFGERPTPAARPRPPPYSSAPKLSFPLGWKERYLLLGLNEVLLRLSDSLSGEEGFFQEECFLGPSEPFLERPAVTLAFRLAWFQPQRAPRTIRPLFTSPLRSPSLTPFPFFTVAFSIGNESLVPFELGSSF